MSDPSAELVLSVLRSFGLDQAPGLSVRPHPGGFSGAGIHRCEWAGRTLCLRAWPAGVAPQRVEWAHDLMRQARQAGLTFVPEVRRGPAGRSWVLADERVWDLTEWMPGVADFRDRPTPARLHAACEGLALVHRAWRHPATHRGPCPAVERRLHTLSRWQRLVRSGWRPTPGPALAPLVGRAWDLLLLWVPRLGAWLDPFSDRPVSLQPCLCDVWHDHLLFEDDRLAGLIDYGEAKLDHVGVDLARLLGSLVGDGEEDWQLGLGAYRAVQPLDGDDEALARLLDRSGVVLGASNWLRWLYRDGRSFPDHAAVGRRLGELVARMERWGGGLIS